MRRLPIIVASCLIGLALAVALLWHFVGDRAMRAGGKLHATDPRVHHLNFPARRGESLVVWLGDSTLMPTPDGDPSYASLMKARHKGRVTHLELASPGLDPFHYYYLMGPALEHRPDIVVLPAHIRFWKDEVETERHVQLLRFVPGDALLDAALLPFAHRRVRLPQLLLMRLLDERRVMNGYIFAEGLRTLFEESALRASLGGPDPPAPGELLGVGAMIEASVRDYDQPLRPSDPMVRVFRAAVEMGVERGSKVLVVVNPIPYHDLPADGWYDAEEYAARIDALAELIEGAGGHVLDLHQAMPREGFRDLMGHFNGHGMEVMRAAIEPTITRLLEEPPPSVAR